MKYRNRVTIHRMGDSTATVFDFNTPQSMVRDMDMTEDEDDFPFNVIKSKASRPGGRMTRHRDVQILSHAYFKGKWAQEFEPSLVYSQFMNWGVESSIRTFFLRQVGRFRHALFDVQGLGVELLELPFVGGVSLVVLLPQKVYLFHNMVKALSMSRIQVALKSEAREKVVEVFLPAFKLDTDYDLEEYLAMKGVSSFSRLLLKGRMGTNSGNHVEEYSGLGYRQKTMIEVQKNGAGDEGLRGEPLDHEFRANHPFLFLVIDRRQDLVLFAGSILTMA